MSFFGKATKLRERKMLQQKRTLLTSLVFVFCAVLLKSVHAQDGSTFMLSKIGEFQFDAGLSTVAWNRDGSKFVIDHIGGRTASGSRLIDLTQMRIDPLLEWRHALGAMIWSERRNSFFQMPGRLIATEVNTRLDTVLLEHSTSPCSRLSSHKGSIALAADENAIWVGCGLSPSDAAPTITTPTVAAVRFNLETNSVDATKVVERQGRIEDVGLKTAADGSLFALSVQQVVANRQRVGSIVRVDGLDGRATEKLFVDVTGALPQVFVNHVHDYAPESQMLALSVFDRRPILEAYTKIYRHSDRSYSGLPLEFGVAHTAQFLKSGRLIAVTTSGGTRDGKPLPKRYSRAFLMELPTFRVVQEFNIREPYRVMAHPNGERFALIGASSVEVYDVK